MDESILDSSLLADRSRLSDSPETDEYDLHNDETFGDDLDMGDDWEQVHEQLAEIEESHKTPLNGLTFQNQIGPKPLELKQSQNVGTPFSSSTSENFSFIRVSNVDKTPIGSPLNDPFQLPPISTGHNLDSLFKLAKSNVPKSPAIKTVEQLEKELQSQAFVNNVKLNSSNSPEVAAAAIGQLNLNINKSNSGPPVLNSWLSQLQQQQMKVNGTPIRTIPVQPPLTPIIGNSIPGRVPMATPIPIPVGVPRPIFHQPVTVMRGNQNPSFPLIVSPQASKEVFIRQTPTHFEPAILRPITPSSRTPPKPSSHGQMLSHLFGVPIPNAMSPQVVDMPSPLTFQSHQKVEPSNVASVETNIIGDGSHQSPMKREYHRRWSIDNDSDHEDRDPYAGLMTPQERHWIAQIQLMPLNTNKPYEDDYYYTMHHHKLAGSYSLRSTKKSVMAAFKMPEVTIVRNSYVPIQFENSLGKLQPGSVVAPRKLIDTVLVDKSADEGSASLNDASKISSLSNRTLTPRRGLLDMPSASPQVQRKSCETLITIEQMFHQVLLLEEDSSPLFNGRKLSNRDELIKTLSKHLNENIERIGHIMSVRKGRLLALRLLPFISDNLNFWKTFISSIETLMKVDNEIYLQFLPFFRRDMQTTTAEELIDLTKSALPVLSFLVGNKVGISILASLVNCGASQYKEASNEEKKLWKSFLTNLVEALQKRTSPERPVVAVIKDVFASHLSELKLSREKIELLTSAL